MEKYSTSPGLSREDTSTGHETLLRRSINTAPGFIEREQFNNDSLWSGLHSRAMLYNSVINSVNTRETKGDVSSELGDPEPAHLLRPLSAAINIGKCIAGVGTFALPVAFQSAGFYGGIVGLLILTGMCYYTMCLLLEVKHVLFQNECDVTYGDLSARVFGRVMYVVVNASILATVLGACSAYLVFMAVTVEQLLDVKELYVILACLPFLILMSWLRSFKYLAFTAVLGDVAFLAGYVAVFYAGLQRPLHPASELPAFRSTFTSSIGSFAFLYCIHFILVPMEQSMARPQLFKKTMACTYLSTLVLNIAMGTCGYMFWGEAVLSPVILNLESGTFVSIAQWLLCVDVFFTYPLVLAAGREIVELYLFPPGVRVAAVEFKRNVLRVFLVGLTISLAILSGSNFSGLVNLVGGVTLSFQALILPPILHLKVYGNRNIATTICNVLVLLIGLAVFGVTGSQSVIALVAP